ncbi:MULTISPECIES: RimK family alpha-L-glutamate ligase [Streptomyces]|uniref:RimK family alpha-L-glutamate ligase n=1 Tax=Streptomyces TaxID=1883 RepID=UPI0009A475BC|nr:MULTISPECIES: RimK family alpha-L-glutamate ligase [Streptomyces]
MDVVGRGADVWLVLGAGLSRRPVTGLIRTALEEEFGDRFAVVSSGELLMGAGPDGLTLRGRDGCVVAAPRVAYGRVWTPGTEVGREVSLLRHLEAMGSVLLNPADAVLACLDKFWQVQRLAAAGLAVPETFMGAGGSLDAVTGAGLPQPCVVKAVRGHRGEQVFLAPDADTLRAVHDGLAPEAACLFQEYVASSHGRDLRVVVVDGHAAGAVVRTASGGEFRSNLALGASLAPCTGRYPQGEELAVRAAAVMGLGVAGVDLLFAPDGDFTVCEVNANAGWQPEMKEVAPALAAACRRRLTAAGRRDASSDR